MEKSLLLVLVVASLCPILSWAQLGRSEDSTYSQLRSLNLSKSEAHSASGFRYKQFSSDRVVVKAYINPATKAVFAMTWKGSRAPSLIDLLGFDPLKITGPGVSRSLHSTLIRTENLRLDILSDVGRYVVIAVRMDLIPKGVSASVVTP